MYCMADCLTVMIIVMMMMMTMMIQTQYDRERSSGRLKDQASETPKKLHSTAVPVHLQNGRRLPPHVHDGHVYHRPFENGSSTSRPVDWRGVSFQTHAAADRSTTSTTAHSPCATSKDARTRRPESSKAAAKYGCDST